MYTTRSPKRGATHMSLHETGADNSPRTGWEATSRCLPPSRSTMCWPVKETACVQICTMLSFVWEATKNLHWEATKSPEKTRMSLRKIFGSMVQI